MSIQNLDQRFSITDKNGNPTDYFMRIIRDRGQAQTDTDTTVTSLQTRLTADEAAIALKADKSETISAGTGLSGGGDLSTPRTISLANTTVTPGTYGDATHVARITVDAQGRLTAASAVAVTGGGGGSAAWTLVNQSGAATTGSTWTWSTNVANVDVTGLGSYNELLIHAIGISAATGANVRSIRVSVDNGATFFGGATDYLDIPLTGATAGQTIFMNHGTATTAARSIVGHIKNLKGPIKQAMFMAGSERYFAASTSDINAIRLFDFAGVNLTGGALYVYAR